MKKYKIVTVLYRVCLCVFVISSLIAGYLYCQMSSADKVFAQLRKEANTPTQPTSVSTTGAQVQIQPAYAALYQQNTDLAGWIQIEGTNIDYPVMYTPQEPEYYLRRSFQREHSYSGVPFIGEGCSLDPRTQNVFIYGHNMLNDTMFTDLTKYKDKSFYDMHPLIRFDTLYQTDLYEIIAAFPTAIHSEDSTDFKFYEHINFTQDAEFADWKKSILAASVYETGTDFESCDDFLTLSTCSYHATNGRFVVIAKKIQAHPGVGGT